VIDDGRGIVILLMAGYAIGGNFFILTGNVTEIAVYGMALGKREKTVLDVPADPS
jgi:hypothetical protein